MLVISQNKIKNQTVYYKCVLNDDGEELSRRLIHVSLKQIRKNSELYFVLYDENMNLISYVFKYLNLFSRRLPLTSKNKSAYALRLLYCYLEIYNLRITSLTELDIDNLIAFLRGVGYLNSRYNNLTFRSAETVNEYFSIYRDFFLKCGVECEPLFRANVKTFISENLLGEFDGNRERRVSYSKNLKTNSKIKRVPKYISVDEFKKIYKYVTSINDIQAMIILHLMYGYGLRIGEVLGITAEDICEVKINSKFVPVIVLRNRLTDKKFQYAKGLQHVQTEEQYSLKEYRNSTIHIPISYDFYEVIEKFVNTVSEYVTKKYPENENSRLADIVSGRNVIEKNTYIFLNRNGKPLSDQAWNKKLKTYFEILGFEYDTEKKESNLNHRFRHGFAMFHARFSENTVDILELQKMMRHKSVLSSMVYFNPTIEDEYETKKQFLDELYRLIPELKIGIVHE